MKKGKNLFIDQSMNKTRHCIACGSLRQSDVKHYNCLFDGREITYRFCGACGLAELNRNQPGENLAQNYPDAYYGLGDRKFIKFFDVLREVLSKYRLRNFRSAVGSKPIKVLDIGCGDGDFLKQIYAQASQIYGVELSGAAFKRASRIPGIHLLPADRVCADSYPKQYFDAITLWHVFEHLPDPLQTLSYCRKWLKSEGYLFIEVPNVSSWQAQLFKANWFHMDAPRHLFLFTPKSLDFLLSRAGFAVARRQYFSFEMGVFGVVQSALNIVIKPRNLFYDMARLRRRCLGPVFLKIVSVLAAAILLPFGFLFAIMESFFNRGAVIRYSCKPADYLP